MLTMGTVSTWATKRAPNIQRDSETTTSLDSAQASQQKELIFQFPMTEMAVVRYSALVVVAAAVVLAATAHPVDPYGGGHKGYKPPPKPYAFSYGIEDKHYGPSFMQQEKSDGHTVKGSYQVQLPDGRLQTVTYTADHDNGFFADVKYSGKAQYPSKGAPPFIVKPHHGGGGGGYH